MPCARAGRGRGAFRTPLRKTFRNPFLKFFR